jgi:hypothetical protein
MDEQNFYPFYLNLFTALENTEIITAKVIDDTNKTEEDYWQQEYELINISHQMENGW